MVKCFAQEYKRTSRIDRDSTLGSSVRLANYSAMAFHMYSVCSVCRRRSITASSALCLSRASGSATWCWGRQSGASSRRSDLRGSTCLLRWRRRRHRSRQVAPRGGADRRTAVSRPDPTWTPSARHVQQRMSMVIEPCVCIRQRCYWKNNFDKLFWGHRCFKKIDWNE